MVLHTVPQWHKLVTVPVAAAGGNLGTILFSMSILVVSSCGHMVAFFWIVKNSGAVSVGVMKSLQAVGTFVVSALLFCERQQSQCFTPERGVATMLVSVGVVVYSWSKVNKVNKKKRGKKKREVEGRRKGEEEEGVEEEEEEGREERGMGSRLRKLKTSDGGSMELQKR